LTEQMKNVIVFNKKNWHRQSRICAPGQHLAHGREMFDYGICSQCATDAKEED
jgi:hypothetical protein